MGKLYYPHAADLTVADKLVLGHLEKDYANFEVKPDASPVDAEESDDSATKRTEFVSPSPEGIV